MANYANELKLFNDKYNMGDFKLDELQMVDNKFRFVDELILGGSSAEKYVSLLSRALTYYFSRNTRVNEEGKYLTSFGPDEFLADFEGLVDAKYVEDMQDKEFVKRDKHDGASFSALNSVFARHKEEFNKTLPTIWMKRLKAKDLDIAELEKITTKATETMCEHKSDKAAMEGNLTNVIVAYEAMRMLRESRGGILGWFWKLFNSTRNEIEETYFLQLESQLSLLDSEGYEIDRVILDKTSRTAYGKTVESRYNVIKKEYEDRLNEANSDISVEDDDGVQEIEQDENTLSGQLKKKASESELKRFVEKTASKLPKPLIGDVNMVIFGMQSAIEGIKEEFDALNKNYEEQMNAGNKEAAMAEYALKVFSIALIKTSEIGYDGGKERVIAAQKFTDAFLKEFSPCNMDESLQEFANGYAVQNPDKIIDSLRTQVEPFLQDRLDDGFRFAKDEMFPEEREQLFDDKNNPFPENSVDKSSQVSQDAQISAPVINSNKQ